MPQKLIEKISTIYKEAKVLAEKYTYDDVMMNTGETQKKISDEYAKQINLTNKYRQKEKDLYFILSLLQEARSNIANTPTGQKTVKQVETYIENIKALLKVYTTIEQMQLSIIRYYDKGGASF